VAVLRLPRYDLRSEVLRPWTAEVGVTDDKRERIKDWAAETRESINARLAAAKAAQSQTRFTIVVMAVISMMMVIASYNAYLSYDHEWILQLTSGRSFNHQTVSELLTTQALQDWAAARTISIGLLGIRVSVDDAAVLGAVALFVLSLWLMLVTRRRITRSVSFCAIPIPRVRIPSPVVSCRASSRADSAG